MEITIEQLSRIDRAVGIMQAGLHRDNPEVSEILDVLDEIMGSSETGVTSVSLVDSGWIEWADDDYSTQATTDEKVLIDDALGVYTSQEEADSIKRNF